MESTEAAYQRDYRRRRKANGGARLTQPVAVSEPEQSVGVPWPRDPAGAVASWSASFLKIPPGHDAAGSPLELPSYFVDFLRDALAPGVREAGCFVARKNAKSACVAVLILAHLAEDGPLRSLGWRCGAASLSREKAAELWSQARDIADASGLRGFTFGRVPRKIESRFGHVAFLSADRSAGHASGFDLAIVDELGLYPEKGRDLVAGLISATSARDGRLLAISVIGDSPLTRELMERSGDPAVAVHVHQAPKDCGLEDEGAWRTANPALGTVKSIEYMRFAARRAAATPSEAPAFRSLDLNQPGVPSRQTIVSLDRWVVCSAKRQPERAGRCFLGFDLGGSASLTAAAVYWPDVSRLEVLAAVGDDPSLELRGQGDGVGDLYSAMLERGELRAFPGRVTPAGPFLEWVAELLDGEEVALALADRYRQAEAMDAMDAAGVGWPVEWRAQGSGKDGSADVRAFQRSIESGDLRPGRSLGLAAAIRESEIRWDLNGNPALQKGRARGRIDVLSAAVLAIGAGERAAVPDAEVSFFHIPI